MCDIISGCDNMLYVCDIYLIFYITPIININIFRLDGNCILDHLYRYQSELDEISETIRIKLLVPSSFKCKKNCY